MILESASSRSGWISIDFERSADLVLPDADGVAGNDSAFPFTLLDTGLRERKHAFLLHRRRAA
jgi:hypothetical protein